MAKTVVEIHVPDVRRHARILKNHASIAPEHIALGECEELEQERELLRKAFKALDADIAKAIKKFKAVEEA